MYTLLIREFFFCLQGVGGVWGGVEPLTHGMFPRCFNPLVGGLLIRELIKTLRLKQ